MSGAGERAVIIDYGSGNLHSAEKAFAKVGAALGVAVEVTDNPERVAEADRVILPGVGAFNDCRDGLEAATGMRAAVEARVVRDGRPFLGVCVGAQLMAARGTERGGGDGLGWLPGVVDEIQPTDPACKIPHMGWNALRLTQPHPLTDGLGPAPYVYFVHSYHFRAERPEHVLAATDHGGEVTAIFGRDNMLGVQFHPEKSQEVGQRLIENFLRWRP